MRIPQKRFSSGGPEKAPDWCTRAYKKKQRRGNQCRPVSSLSLLSLSLSLFTTEKEAKCEARVCLYRALAVKQKRNEKFEDLASQFFSHRETV